MYLSAYRLGFAVLHLNTSMGSGIVQNRVLLLGLLLCCYVGIAGCVASPAGVPTATLTAVRSSTSAPTRSATLTRSPSRVVTATRVLAEITLRWDGAIIADADDVHDIVLHLKNTPGIIDGTGDEIQITIRYDPQIITPEKIQRVLADLGFPTRRP